MTNEMYEDLLFRIDNEEKRHSIFFVIPLNTFRELNEEQKLDLLIRAIKYNDDCNFKIWLGVSGGFEHLSYYMKDIIEKYRLLLDER